MNKNIERAYRGRRLLNDYRRGLLFEDDPQDVLSDALTDLMHLCATSEMATYPGGQLDFAAALERAQRHFEAEQAGDDDA